MTARDAAFDEWIERARQVTCRAELERRGLWTRKMLGDAGNPCPGLRRPRPVRGEPAEKPVLLPAVRRRRRRDRAGAAHRRHDVPAGDRDGVGRAGAFRRKLRKRRAAPGADRPAGGARQGAGRGRQAPGRRRREVPHVGARGGVQDLARRPADRRHDGRGLPDAARADGAGGGTAALPSRAALSRAVARARGAGAVRRAGAARRDPGGVGAFHRRAPDLARSRRRRRQAAHPRPGDGARSCRRRRSGARSAVARSASPGIPPT